MNDGRGFAGVRRDDGVRLAGEYRILQRLVFSQHAKRIRIDDEGNVAGDGVLKALFGLFRKAHSAADDDGVCKRQISLVGDHEFGLQRIKGRGLVAHYFDDDGTRAHLECRTRRQERGADGSRFAADHDDAAVGTLVRILRTRFGEVFEVVRVNEGNVRERHGHVEVVEQYRSCGIGAFVHEAAGFGSEKIHGDVRSAAGDVPDPAARHHVDSARKVDAYVQGLAFVKPQYCILPFIQNGAL